MFGIDIIDLKDPLLKERTKRSFRLINHPEDLCFESQNSFWLLWAAKEAVFKVNRELVSFVPKKIPIQIKPSNDTITFHSSGITSGVLFCPEDLIIALASKENISGIGYHFFKKETKNESKEARNAIKKFILDQFSIDVNVSQDENGLPVLDYKHLPVSISHHGNFIAFAYQKHALLKATTGEPTSSSYSNLRLGKHGL